jgi:glycosyltransferase involved in cell wall biosynthesis
MLLAATDLFVLPSLWEGLPLALLEALSAGCAVVASDVEGVREILVDYDAASFAASEDSDALANAMLYLLEHEEERLALAHRGVGLAQKYSSESMCGQYESLIRELAISSKN